MVSTILKVAVAFLPALIKALSHKAEPPIPLRRHHWTSYLHGERLPVDRCTYCMTWRTIGAESDPCPGVIAGQ